VVWLLYSSIWWRWERSNCVVSRSWLSREYVRNVQKSQRLVLIYWFILGHRPTCLQYIFTLLVYFLHRLSFLIVSLHHLTHIAIEKYHIWHIEPRVEGILSEVHCLSPHEPHLLQLACKCCSCHGLMYPLVVICIQRRRCCNCGLMLMLV